MTVKAAQPLTKAVETFKRALLRILLKAFVTRQACAQTDRLAQRIKRIDLVSDTPPWPKRRPEDDSAGGKRAEGGRAGGDRGDDLLVS